MNDRAHRWLEAKRAGSLRGASGWRVLTEDGFCEPRTLSGPCGLFNVDVATCERCGCLVSLQTRQATSGERVAWAVEAHREWHGDT